mgnify:CR=1 FL=1
MQKPLKQHCKPRTAHQPSRRHPDRFHCYYLKVVIHKYGEQLRELKKPTFQKVVISVSFGMIRRLNPISRMRRLVSRLDAAPIVKQDTTKATATIMENKLSRKLVLRCTISFRTKISIRNFSAFAEILRFRN